MGRPKLYREALSPARLALLRSAIKALGSQNQFAKLLGIDKGTLSHYLNGVRPMPVALLHKMLIHLPLEANEFIAQTEAPLFDSEFVRQATNAFAEQLDSLNRELAESDFTEVTAVIGLQVQSQPNQRRTYERTFTLGRRSRATLRSAVTT